MTLDSTYHIVGYILNVLQVDGYFASADKHTLGG